MELFGFVMLLNVVLHGPVKMPENDQHQAEQDRGDDPVSVIRRLSFRCMARAAAERRLAVARMTNLSKITEPK